MTCDHAYDAGPYVLGSLAPAERLEFERHLATCDACARTVRELAGLPGLLARVPAEALEEPAADAEPVPSTLLPRLVRASRRERLRRTWVTAGLSAAATAAVLTVGVGAAGLVGDDAGRTDRDRAGTTAPPVVPGQAMTPLVPTPVTATLGLRSVAWGTSLHLVCAYDLPTSRTTGAGAGDGASGWGEGGGTPTGGGGAEREWVYALVVRTRAGTEEQVATWRAVPGKTMRLDAATATSRDDIASVQVRTTEGRAVLELAS